MSIACLIYVLMSCIANGYRSFVSTTTHCRFTCLFFTVLIIICHYYQSLFSVIVIPICVEIWLEISAPPPPLANSVIMRILSVVGRAMMRERTVYPPSNAKAKNDIAYTSYLQLPRLGPTIILFLHHQCLPNIPWRHLLPEFAWYIPCNSKSSCILRLFQTTDTQSCVHQALWTKGPLIAMMKQRQTIWRMRLMTGIWRPWWWERCQSFDITTRANHDLNI